MNPLLLKFIGILAGIAIVAGGAAFEMHKHDTAVFTAYKAAQTIKADTQVIHNQVAVAAITASEADGLRQIAANATESQNEIQKRNDALVAANSDLAGKLRARLAIPDSWRPVVPKTAAGGPVDHGASDAALSDGLADLVKFNTSQFYAADVNAVALTAAQAVIVQDRQICNGQLPGVSP